MLAKCADLHVHTIYSDGTFSPEKVVLAAAHAGVSAIAISDHDTVEGVSVALESSAGCNIEVIPAIELTADYKGAEIHVLGFFVDHTNKKFLKKLQQLKQDRIDRVYKIIAKLKTEGITLSPDTVFRLSPNGTVGRLHIAQAMVEEKCVNTIAEAFRKYIGDRSRAYVSGFRFSVSDAVDLIKGVYGIPVLAHPYLLKDKEQLLHCINEGIMGLEVFYPEHTSSMVASYSALAKKHNLLLTGGSDFHGSVKPNIKIGNIRVGYRYVEALRNAHLELG